jgi:hypothetical protein
MSGMPAVGKQVRIRRGVRVLDGPNAGALYNSYVYEQPYDVIEVINDRLVFGKGQAVTGAVRTCEVYVV